VIVHKALLELGRKLRQPVKLSDGPDKRLFGNVTLRMRRDGAICVALAKSDYHPDLGARSLKAAAGKVKKLLAEEYLNIDEDIAEQGGVIELIVVLDGEEVVVTKSSPYGQ
jgi:hypothetical protein